jgi:hypothetical protein
MSRLLDDVDIINQRLKSEVSKLEEELTVLRDRHILTHENLQACRNEVKQLEEMKRNYAVLEKKYNVLLNALQMISEGDKDADYPAFAKRKLEDL